MAAVFAPGRFYGTPSAEHRLPGLTISHLAGTTPEHDVAEHSHDDAHFVLATRGRYVTTALGEAAEGPVLVFNPPGVVHRDRFAGDGGWFLAISFPAEVWRSLAVRPSGDALRLSEPRAVRTALAILRAATTRDPDQLHLESLALDLTADAGSWRQVSQHPPAWLETAERYISDNLGSPLSISEIATAVGVHRVHLARAFRRWNGCSPGDRLRQRRLESAAAQLAGTRRDLCDIALRAGFCDQSHLSRVFRRAWGMPPGEYRRLTAGAQASYVQDEIETGH